MFAPTFHAPFDVQTLNILLEALVRIDLHILRKDPSIPDLYASGVRYEREPNGVEEWLTIPEIMRRGYDDCEGLAAWLAAEYRNKGIMAQAFASRVPTRAPIPLYHVRVRLRGGRVIEDPSRALGLEI